MGDEEKKAQAMLSPSKDEYLLDQHHAMNSAIVNNSEKANSNSAYNEYLPYYERHHQSKDYNEEDSSSTTYHIEKENQRLYAENTKLTHSNELLNIKQANLERILKEKDREIEEELSKLRKKNKKLQKDKLELEKINELLLEEMKSLNMELMTLRSKPA